MLLSSERAALSEATFPPSGLAQDEGAAATGHHSLGMTEHCGDPVAAWAFYIHEVGVGTLNQPLLLVSLPLSHQSRVH